MKRCLWSLILLLLICLQPSLAAATMSVDLYLAPNGGFSPYNNQRELTFADGRTTPASLNNALLDISDRVPRGGAIKIVMYNFNFDPLLKLLLTKALTEEVQVKVLLDNCAGWTAENVKDFIASVKSTRKQAEKTGKPFDFQVKVVTPAVFKKHGRTRVLDDGKEIIGTMHQKFGLFYLDKNADPVHVFAGSSNISPSADQEFAENRIFFRNAPDVGKVFANQFARLWNIYSEPATEGVTEEKSYDPQPEIPFEVIFNGEHIGKLEDKKFHRIDERILKLMDEVKPEGGSLDIMMFSFTHWNLGNRIIDLAKERPNAKFRLFFDHSMLTTSEQRKGLMPPYIEEKVKELDLKNVEIRFKFRANAYGYSKETKKVELDHFRSPLLHDKLMIVNKEAIVFGSYNWSASAEERNFEDVMVFRADTDFGKEVITRFLHEMDYLWEKTYDGLKDNPGAYHPYSITGPYARELEPKIIQVLEDFIPSKIRQFLDRQGPMTEKQLLKKGKFTRKALEEAIQKLTAVLLIEKFEQDGQPAYRLRD